jgi:hypothetical protein
MILTELQLCRRKNIRMPQGERIRKVRKSMAAIKVTLGERKRDKIAQVALENMQKTIEANEEDEEEFVKDAEKDLSLS